MALVFIALGQWQRALVSYDEGLRLQPDDPELRNGRGVALLKLNRPGEALADFDHVLAAEPDYRDAIGNRGNALLRLNRVADAVAAYDLALAYAPDSAQLLANRAAALRRLDRPHEALASAQAALALAPDFAHAQFVEAVARLTLGDFAAGWLAYKSRWQIGWLASQRRDFAAPLWLGAESLNGKTILLHAEQGLGDTIQFARYAPLLAARGATVILEVQRELVRLLSDLLAPRLWSRVNRHCRFTTFIARYEPAARLRHHACDHSGGGSLYRPGGCRDGRVAGAPAGSRAPDRARLVGRALARQRSQPLAAACDARAAARPPDVTFVSLQHEVRDEDAVALDSRSGLVQIGPHFRDFADTAAAIACLDAVISVDTAVAHLAGAMGKPLFLLLPFAADFRWLRQRSDNPWYPSAQLLRQPQFGDWDSVVNELRQKLIQPDARGGLVAARNKHGNPSMRDLRNPNRRSHPSCGQGSRIRPAIEAAPFQVAGHRWHATTSRARDPRSIAEHHGKLAASGGELPEAALFGVFA